MNETIPILQLLLARGLGARTLYKILRILHSRQYTPFEFVRNLGLGLVTELSLKPGIIESVKQTRELAVSLADELERNAIAIIPMTSAKYPHHVLKMLGESSPPVFFAKGNLFLLNKKSVAFCGSRQASKASLDFVDRSSGMLAEKDINIVSGYAPGVDMAAHKAALKSGGFTTMVLATGILHFNPRNDIADLLNENNHLIFSEFSPKIGWNIGNAMQRNQTICGLSDVMVVVESGLKGGTYEAGKAALRLQCPLFVAEYSKKNSLAEGNKFFLEHGAKALRGNKSGNPNLKNIVDTLESPPLHKSQADLFG